MKRYTKPLIKGLEIASHVILKMVNYVMNFAPLGVFGAISAVIATQGFRIFKFYGLYFFYFLIGNSLSLDTVKHNLGKFWCSFFKKVFPTLAPSVIVLLVGGLVFP